MTVCIAAICENGYTIVGAADRMITMGGIEFETTQSKIVPMLLPSGMIAALIAGVSEDLTPIIQAAYGRMQTDAVTDVARAAEIIGKEYRRALQAEKVREVLQPLGISLLDLFSGKLTIPPDILDKLVEDLKGEWLPQSNRAFGGSILVVGRDQNEQGGLAHVYAIDHLGGLTCYDWTGYAAIGSGGRTAIEHFAFSKYVRATSYAEAILTVYSAKKRAEAARGVGPSTDLFVIGQLSLGIATDEQKEAIHNIYQSAIDASDKAVEDAKKEMEELVNAISKEQAPESALTVGQDETAQGGNAETDQGDVPAEPKEGEPTS